MKKEIFVNGVHDYTIEVNKNIYSLFYSPDEAWTRPNELVMKLVDDGNGLKIQQRKKNRLDYDESVELNILLKVYYLLREEKFEIVDNKIKL